MNINDIYIGTVWSFEVLPTKVDAVVRLEPKNRRVSVLYKDNGKYLDILTDKVLEEPEHRVVQTVIFANNNEVDEFEEYVFPEYLSSFKDYAEMAKLNVQEEMTKREWLQVIRNDEFLLSCLKEEVENEKNIRIRF